MTATYSSFDTFTLGHQHGPATSPDGRLPVLAEIPKIAQEVESRASVKTQDDTPVTSAPVTQRIDLCHREPTSPPPPIEEIELAAKSLLRTAETNWEHEPWTARLLEWESIVRPHARLIVLATLIALTGLSLVLLRAPIAEPRQPPPRDIVAAPDSQPEFALNAQPSLVVDRSSGEAPRTQSTALEPVPPLPQQPDLPSRAVITAVGPASAPMQAPWLRSEPITPLGPALPWAEQEDLAATSAGPAASTPNAVRVAGRSLYPSTDSPGESWRPAPDAATTPRKPPVAHLLQPTSP